MSSTDLQTKSTEYFSTLNPLASKIHQDIKETKDSYDEMWKKLSTEEQMEIINEALIKPEITLWYYDLQQQQPQQNCNELSSSEKSSLLTPLDSVTSPDTKLTPSGTLYNFDGKNLSTFTALNPDIFPENGSRDEHAPPFSYKTKSQMNLQLFGSSKTITSPRIILSPERFSKNITQNGLNSVTNMNSSIVSGKENLRNKEKSDVKFERFYNNEKNSKAGFFTKFLSSVTGGAIANGHGQEVDSDDMEYTNLVPTKSISNYSDSDEVDLLNTSEDSQKLLLHSGGQEDPETEDCDFDLRKNFDFLNNW